MNINELVETTKVGKLGPKENDAISNKVRADGVLGVYTFALSSVNQGKDRKYSERRNEFEPFTKER